MAAQVNALQQRTQDELCAGSGNWRKAEIQGNTPMTHEMASAAASKGENWAKFFVSNSEFHSPSIEGPEFYPLNSSNLPKIAKFQRDNNKSNVMPPPVYARSLSTFESVICHIGVGGFHRSHMAMYTHERLLSQMSNTNNITDKERWGIIGIGIMPWDSTMGDVLNKQDNMYTVIGRDSDSTTGTIVGSLIGFVGPDKETENNVLERLANAQTKIVSLTITEKGYCFNVDGKLDLNNSLVKHDLENPNEVCQSAVGTIVKALKLRYDRHMNPFTVMSCDNLPGNGHLTEQMVLDYLVAFGDVEFTEWVRNNCTFPNTMVDRITPATRPSSNTHEFSDTVRALVRETCGVEDEWPVIAERYIQWVIEDKFVCGRPKWEEEGALFVKDVGPYEAMKLRLLNAGHSAIAYSSYLMSHRYVDVAMDANSLLPKQQNPVPQFCLKFFKEQAPNVPPVPGVDLEEYQQTLIKRFGNPNIKDTLQRLAEDGSQKMLSTMREAAIENSKQGRSVACFALVVSTWIRYLVGVDEAGVAIEITDPRSSELIGLARSTLNCPDGVLPVSAPTSPPIKFLEAAFGEELASNNIITTQIFNTLTEIVNSSTHAYMTKLVSETAAE